MEVEHELLEADRLPHLRAEWQALEQGCAATAFQTYDWCLAWLHAARSAGVPEQTRILVQRIAGRVSLIWPLAVRRLGPCLILHTLGEPATQYSDVLLSDEHDPQKLIELAWTIIASWKEIDAIELRRVRETSVLSGTPMLRRHEARGSLDAAPFVDFGKQSPESVIAQRKGRSRNALRRHERQLAKHGEVVFEVLGGPAEQLDAYLEACRLKEEWRERKVIASAGYAHPASPGCLQALAMAGLLTGARLRVGEDTAAIELGMTRNGVYLSLVQSYDQRFARHAPGRILFWYFLDRCPELGIRVFDFLAPATRHKQEWCDEAMPIKDYVVPVSLRGRLAAFYLSRAKPALKRLYLRLPDGAKKLAGSLLHRLS